MSSTSLTALENQVRTAVVAFTRDTGLNLQASYFELRVHPDDFATHLQTSRGYGMWASGREVGGVPLVIDATVTQGHPVLRCRWERVL